MHTNAVAVGNVAVGGLLTRLHPAGVLMAGMAGLTLVVSLGQAQPPGSSHAPWNQLSAPPTRGTPDVSGAPSLLHSFELPGTPIVAASSNGYRGVR
ncbi:hypothetical protein ELE36_12855 [Pseudolysobacter antarcticus]|uniref:Uncharacterized protein n=1 Tax=Pseudolysobacter antarcticus TaxID=2511995 RepID=A0A411HKW6_9GAMM|nr:hypothetical protein [Pseudolysobacter antarcticus]QBB71169.1 hypothetical protein ELE36_12855 [Pseudolysobacter antarcticus]